MPEREGMEQLAPLHALLPEDFPDAMRELVELLFLQLLEEAAALGEASPDMLAGVALRQIDRVSLELGGSSVYLHKGVSWRLTPRNRQIAEEFRGDYRVLARKWKLSEQQVRNIVDSWLRDAYLRRQSDMFQPGPSKN